MSYYAWLVIIGIATAVALVAWAACWLAKPIETKDEHEDAHL